MIESKVEIEGALKEGRKILLDHPELRRMNLHEIIDELDDGTNEMLTNRWGVVAWLVVERLKGFDIKTLVEDLPEVDIGVLIYEYVGYLLQKEYQVDIEKLILKADECGKFNKIVLYVEECLIYETELHEEYLLPILDMMERHKRYDGYHTFLWNYAQHITIMQAQQTAERILGDLSGETQYEFMRNLRREWYRQDEAEGNKVIGRMLERKSVWSKKIAIDFFESSLRYSIETFERYFFQVRELGSEGKELHQMVIPVFVQYILEKEKRALICSDQIYNCVLDDLKKVPVGSLDSKRAFLEAMQREEKIPEELQGIFDSIVECSFDRDQQILRSLDLYLYLQAKKGKWKETLQIMYKIFAANGYRSQYRDFFVCINTVHELQKYKTEITLEAIEFMLTGGLDRFFFGLGLFMKVDDVQKYLFDEHMFNSDMQSMLRKALYFVGESDYRNVYFECIIDGYIKQLSEKDKPKEQKKKLASLSLASQMIAQYAADEKVYKISIMVTEYLIIRYWKYLLEHDGLGKTQYIEWLHKFLSAYEKWNQKYYESIRYCCEGRNRLPFYNSIEQRVLLYEILGYLITYAYYLSFKSQYDELANMRCEQVHGSIISLINNYPQFLYPPYDQHVGIVSMLYRFLERLKRTEDIDTLLHNQCMNLAHYYCMYKKYPTAADSFEDAVNIDMGFSSEDYVTSGFWGTMLQWMVLMEQEKLYQQLQLFLEEGLEKVTKCVWFLRAEEETKFYDAYAMNQAGDGVAIEAEKTFEMLKEKVQFIMQQYNSEQFSFEVFSFEPLEFIVCRYYGYLVRVKREE